MASTKFVKKFNPKQTMRPEVKNDEYFIPSKGISRVQQFKQKVESMYDILIQFDQEVEDADGQWIVIKGEQLDRKNAKNYIKALTDPSEVKQIQFPSDKCSEFTDPQTLEEIEKHTNAFIRPLQKIAQFEISGTELAVTLAMSQMEELAATAGVTDTSADDTDNDANIITISPANQNASSRLSDQLQRALSENSDGVCSLKDYLQAPNTVKRVLVNCLQNDADDIDDDLLFADGELSDSATEAKTNTNITLITPLKTSSRDGSDVDEKAVTDKVSPNINILSEQMDSVVVNEKFEHKFKSNQHKYLYDFGITVGYPEPVVNEALKSVNDKTRPSDFIDLLSVASEAHVEKEKEMIVISDSEDVVIESTEEVYLTDGKEHIEIIDLSNDEVVTKPKPLDIITVGSSTLPEGYREKLLLDFFQEDENCSIEDLKRRNAERQKLLRENFLKANPPAPQKGNNSGKGKGKKKKKQNQQQNQTLVKNQPDVHELPHDKQFKLNHVKSNSAANDSDETCVMKVWTLDSADPCTSTQSGYVNTTPRRKQSQNQWSEVVQNAPQPGQGLLGPWPTPGSQQWNPYQPSHHWNKTAGPGSSGVPPVGSPFKPTQVVAPVSMHSDTPGAQQTAAAVDSASLRYIVIDGSNVAMTHGNGKFFSCKGLRIAVDYFKQRGHEHITVFVPQWRSYRPSNDNPIMDQYILEELKAEEVLVFTPARRIGKRLIASYDDRFVLELAEAEEGIVVSNDQYRDLMTEKASWRKLVEERLLMFTFAKDRFMPPSDPLGRDGPCLDEFLKKAKKKFGFNRQDNPDQHNYPHQYQQHQHNQQPKFQPWAPHKNFHQQQQQQQQPGYHQTQNAQGQGHYRNQWQPHGNQYDTVDASGPSQGFQKGNRGHQRGNQGYTNFKGQGQNRGILTRSEEETESLYKELKVLFPEPDQDEKIRLILNNHELETDLTKLTNYCMSILF